jgi:hypothetical protein
MGLIINIVSIFLIIWGVGKIFAPLFDTGQGVAHYMGSLTGWCMAILFFGWLFGLL